MSYWKDKCRCDICGREEKVKPDEIPAKWWGMGEFFHSCDSHKEVSLEGDRIRHEA